MKGHRKPRWSIWLGVAFAIAAAAAAQSGSAKAAPVSPPAGQAVVLAGFTSQQYPVFFKVTANGRKLALAGIALNMTCTSGTQFVLEDAFAGVPFRAGGKLQRAFVEPPTSGSNGDTIAAKDSLSARLGPQHTQLSGVWRLIVHYAFSNGMTDDCDSGPVRFSATD